MGSYLENPPWNTAHEFSESQNRERRGEAGNGDDTGHPAHEEHHGSSSTESILAPHVENETGELANIRRVRKSRLPSGRDELLTGGGINFAESLLELGLTVERGDLNVVQTSVSRLICVIKTQEYVQ